MNGKDFFEIESIPNGNMDLDTDEYLMKPGDRRESWNMRFRSNKAPFSFIPAKMLGNTKPTTLALPPGTNKTIGRIEDRKNNTLYYFNYNSLGRCQIRRYKLLGNVIEAIESADFDWDPNNTISAVNIVDDMLFWTDRRPRKLNIKKCFNNDKVKQSNIYVLDGPFEIEVRANNSIYTVSFSTAVSVDQVIIALQADASISTGLEFEKCNGYIEAYQRTADNGYEISSTGTGGIVVPQNYFYEIVEVHFDAAKAPFNVPPTVTLIDNASMPFDNLAQRTFQFEARPVFDDNEKAVLGHTSDIVFNSFDLKLNCARIDYTSSRLNDPNILSMIKWVELFFREGNDGKFKLIKKLRQSELWQLGSIGVNTFDFYNNEFYPTISDEEAEKQVDVIPIKPIDDGYTIGQDLFDNRIGHSKYQQGYDQPCDNSVITAEFQELPLNTYNIVLDVRITSFLQLPLPNTFPNVYHVNPNNPQNVFVTGINALECGTNTSYILARDNFQPATCGIIYKLEDGTIQYGGVGAYTYAYDKFGAGAGIAKQKMHLPGFVIYAANTDYFCVSEQILSVPTVIYNTDGTLDASSESAKQKIWDSYDGNATPDYYSRAHLKNLPPGIYVLRVASPKCSLSDEEGGMYNLNNGRAYQRTSAPVAGFFDYTGTVQYPNQIGDYELTVTINNDGSFEVSSQASHYPPTTGQADANKDIHVGQVLIRDLSFFLNEDSYGGALAQGGISITGYLYDGVQDFDPLTGAFRNELKEGIAIEGAVVDCTFVNGDNFPQFSNYPFTPAFGLSNNNMTNVVASCVTDHNGFYYFAHLASLCGGPASNPPSPSGDPGNPSAGDYIKGYCLRAMGYAGHVIKEYYLSEIYFGSLNDLVAGSLVRNTNLLTGGGFNRLSTLGTNIDGAHYETVIENTNGYFHYYDSTILKGTVVDQNNNPLANVPVVYERNNRGTVTGTNGEFNIVVYLLALAENSLNGLLYSNNNTQTRNGIYYIGRPLIYNAQVQFAFRRIFDSIIVSPYGNNYFFTPGIYRLFVGLIGADPNYNLGNPYDLAVINPIYVRLLISAKQKLLKTGVWYNFAIVHADTINRKHELIDKGAYYVPFWTEDVQNYYPYLPSQQALGVTTFTLDLTNQTPPEWADEMYILRTAYVPEYLQFPAYDIKYVINFTVTPATPTDPEVITIEETSYESRSANRIWIAIPQAITAYSRFKQGSLKTWTWIEGDRLRFIKNSDSIYAPTYIDVPILGVSPNGYSFVIANDTILPELETGYLLEVYRSLPSELVKRFWEIPETVGITNGQYDRTIVPINTGDTYRRTRLVPILNGIISTYVEDNSVSDFYPSKVDDRGRPNVQTGFTKALLLENTICFSNKYFSGTLTNGLSSFDADNVVQTPQRLGSITFIKTTNDDAYQQVVLAMHQNGGCTFYIGAAQLMGANGPDITVTTSNVLGSFRVLVGDFGCTDAASMSFKDGYVAWFDPTRGAFCRYAANGITPISEDGFHYNASQIPALAKLISVFDTYHEQFVWAILDETGESYSVAYDNKKDERGWSGFINLAPECFGTIGNKTYAFKDGEIWLQESNPVTGSFFGVKYPHKIRMVFSREQKTMKVWTNVAIYATQKWWCPDIANRYGQQSRLIPDKMVKQENVFNAAIMRDLNDTAFTNPDEALMNGAHLRSETINILFQNDDGEFGVIFSAIAASTLSPITTR